MTAPAPTVSVETDQAARRISLAFPFDAPVDRVWAELTEHGSVSRWLTTAAPVPGSAREHLLTFEHEGRTHTKTFTVTACERESLLAGTLHDPGFPDSSLQARIDDARLVFTHSDVPEELFEGYRAGWTHYLGALCASLAGGTGGDRR